LSNIFLAIDLAADMLESQTWALKTQVIA